MVRKGDRDHPESLNQEVKEAHLMTGGLKKDAKKMIGTKGHQGEMETGMTTVQAVIGIIVMIVIVAEVVTEDEATARIELMENLKNRKKKISNGKKTRKLKR